MSKKSQFGSSSERFVDGQMRLLNEDVKDVDNDEHYKSRLELSRPVLDAFYLWLTACLSMVLPKVS